MDLFIERCRLCLEDNSDGFNVFDKSKNIITELSTCLSIEITQMDALPKSICKKCVSSLHEFYLFYINSKQSEKILLSYTVENTPDFSSNCLSKNDVENNLDISNHSDNKYLSDYLDNINTTFDLDLLTNNSRALSALDCLESSSDIVDVTQKLLNNGVKLKKIPKANNSNSADESIEIHMEIDVLDSEMDIVNKILSKESRQKNSTDKANNSIPEKYSCLSCKSIFNDFNLLENHMMQCSAIKRIQGNKIYINRRRNNTKINNQVTKTLKTTSDINCVYRCKKCWIIFQFKDLLYAHIKSYHTKKSNLKSTSDIVFTDGGTEMRYKNTKINDNFIYRCKVCHAICVDKNTLYDHIKEHAYDLKKSQLVCDTCGKHFKSFKDLSQHILTHANDIYVCSECSEIFTDVKILEAHLTNHDHEATMCESCGSLFSTKELLEAHQKNKTDECNSQSASL